jgi:serine/threonine-protein kinase
MATVGNYRLETELAAEPTHTTYLASHRVMPRKAIVKVMREVEETAEQFVAVQLLREACLMATLHHAGVPTIYESGLVGRRPWFAFEHIAGASLAGILALGSIDRHQAIILMRDLAEILDHAHQQGVVHAGLQPAHVVLANRPHNVALCIVDWSTARAHDAAPQPYAPTLESWHYTAPELVRGDAATNRADTYSLGVIAHQLLSGVPFARGSSPGLEVANLPQELVDLVDAMVRDEASTRPSCHYVHRIAAHLVETHAPLATPAGFRIRKPRWTPDVVYRTLTTHPIGKSAFDESDD